MCFCSQWNPDGESPVYAIVVHSAAEEHEALPPGGESKERDGDFNSEGWVVTRRFRDFETLHVNLKEVHVVTCNVLNIPLTMILVSAHVPFTSSKHPREYYETGSVSLLLLYF